MVDVRSSGSRRRETHRTDREASAVIKNVVGSRFATDCFYSGGQYQGMYFLKMKCEENIEIKNLFFTKRLTFVLSWIHFIKTLLNFEASVMCNWWPLLYRIDWHTPGYKVHSFLSDKMAWSSYIRTSV